MARLWSCGFELQSVTSGVEVDTTIGSPSISTTTVRSGSASLRISSLASGLAQGVRHRINAVAANGPYFVRAYLRITTLPSAENRIMFLNDSDNQTTPMVWITLDSGGLLRFYDEDGQIGSASSALSTGTWYRIEIKVDRTTAAGSHIAEALIDGTAFASASNLDLSAGIHTYAVGGNLISEAQTTGDWFFDDLAVNDSTGSFQADYPGEGEIIHLRPSGTGDNDDWTGDYTDIDEITPDDATTFISSNTNNQIIDVNIDNTPAALESTDVINCVQVGFRANLSDATGGDPNAVLRIKSDTGATVEESSNLGGNTTTWNTNGFASPRNYKLTLYDLPGASTTAWTKSTLDTAQIGVRETVTDTHNYQVSALWLLVDHKPGAVSTKAPIPYRSLPLYVWRK